jgi:hypothetical protein
MTKYQIEKKIRRNLTYYIFQENEINCEKLRTVGVRYEQERREQGNMAICKHLTKKSYGKAY